MKFIDIHAHPTFTAYDADREAMLARLKEADGAAIGVGVDLLTSKKEVALAEQHDHLYASVGIHPVDNVEEEYDAKEFEALVQHKKVVAVGECGLDFYRREKTPEEYKRQLARFEAQLTLAVERDLPLMIHCRDAHEELLSLLGTLAREYGERLRGNIHFFTAPKEIAKRYFDLGFTISFPGVITFAPEVQDVVRYAPLERIHAETDSPFASPLPHRGKRNEPAYVREVISKIAHVKELPFDTVALALVENAGRIFALGKSS